ncbi:acyl carrier protein [Streptomyces sp. NPDC058964]|uniref:acyl carrier protein n=1 Tax=Streptomyces sp. NPDC058964 TaxID=3346681 RepID=UPI003679B5D4
MSDEPLLATVHSIVQDVAPGRRIDADTPLIAERIIDSLALISLIVRLEKEFDVHIPDSEIDPENFDNLRAIVAFLKSKGC